MRIDPQFIRQTGPFSFYIIASHKEGGAAHHTHQIYFKSWLLWSAINVS